MWLIYFTVHSKQIYLYSTLLKQFRRQLFVLRPVKMCISNQDLKCLLSFPLELASPKGSWARPPHRQLTSFSAVLGFFQPGDFCSRSYLSFHIENCHKNSSSAAERTEGFDKQQLFLSHLSQTPRYQLP